MNPIHAKPGFKSGSKPGSRPPAAIEIAPEGVMAASLPAPGQSPVYAFQALPAGAVLPGIGEANLRAPQAVAEAIRSALDAVSPRSRAVTVVIPDTAVRVFVLDFDSLPAKIPEVLSVLRFRLRKMLPFEVEHAGLSYQILSESKNEVKVLAAVLPAPILAEYEAVVRAAGYEPGAVLPASLAALDAVDSLEAVLLANLNGLAMTTAIANGNDLLLYRTVELPLDPASRLAEAQRGIAVAAAYFEDRLQAPPQRLYYAGDGGADEFARWIGDLDLEVADLVPRPSTGAATALGYTSLAGTTGALAGAR